MMMSTATPTNLVFHAAPPQRKAAVNATKANADLLKLENKCRLPPVFKRRAIRKPTAKPVAQQWFDVESIRDHRHGQHLVRWAGFDASNDTWESTRTLMADGVGHMIQRYNAMEALITVAERELRPLVDEWLAGPSGASRPLL
jgi:hypothetical protein